MRDIDEFYAALGAAVRLRRDQLGLTQTELSERVGLSRTSITNIERGRQRLLADQLHAVASSLRIPADALLREAARAREEQTRSPEVVLRGLPSVAAFVESRLAELRAEDA